MHPGTLSLEQAKEMKSAVEQTNTSRPSNLLEEDEVLKGSTPVSPGTAFQEASESKAEVLYGGKKVPMSKLTRSSTAKTKLKKDKLQKLNNEIEDLKWQIYYGNTEKDKELSRLKESLSATGSTNLPTGQCPSCNTMKLQAPAVQLSPSTSPEMSSDETQDSLTEKLERITLELDSVKVYTKREPKRLLKRLSFAWYRMVVQMR